MPDAAAHHPEARPSREERLARLSPEDRAAVEVWSLGRRARDLAAAGDPDAPAAEAAYREAEAAAIEAEILMRRVDVEDLKARYPVLARDAEVTVGVGWQPLLETLLDRLAGMSVTVPPRAGEVRRARREGLPGRCLGACGVRRHGRDQGTGEGCGAPDMRGLRGAGHHAAGRAVADAVRPARRHVRRVQNSRKNPWPFPPYHWASRARRSGPSLRARSADRRARTKSRETCPEIVAISVRASPSARLRASRASPSEASR